MTRLEIIDDKNSRQSSLRASSMQRVVCLPERSDGTESILRGLGADVRGCDSIGAVEVGHDESEIPRHSLAF